MKKIILTMAGMVLIGLASVNAQTDTTVVQPQTQQDELGTDNIADQQQGQDELKKEDRMEIQKDELPAAVRSTLVNGNEYKGWEEAALYHEKTSDLYLIHITDDEGTRTYRFDKDGQPVTDNSSIKNE